MTVYVDNSRIPWRGKIWCHLVADSVGELHAFAAQLGLRREWFQDQTMYPHYDVTVSVQQRAIALGAQIADKKTIVACAKRLRTELSEQKLREAAAANPPRSAPACPEVTPPGPEPLQRPLFGA